MILIIALSMFITILMESQVKIIISKYELSYIIIFIKNHQKLSTYNMFIIKIQTCTTSVLQHIHMFIMLYSKKSIDLVYISRLHNTYVIIISFKLKSNMNLQTSLTYNIIYIYNSTCPEGILYHIHSISWFKQQSSIQ